MRRPFTREHPNAAEHSTEAGTSQLSTDRLWYHRGREPQVTLLALDAIRERPCCADLLGLARRLGSDLEPCLSAQPV